MKKVREWSPKEDKCLIQAYKQVDCFQRWKIIVQKMKDKGINKTQTECRDRYVNKLNPDLNHEKLTPQEIKTIFKLYDSFGSQWSEYEGLMEGRNQNVIKNKFYSTIRSCVRSLVLCFLGNSYSYERLRSLKLTSKKLMSIYEGEKEFKKFKGLVSKSLEILDYDCESKKTNGLEENLDRQVIEDFTQHLMKQKIFELEKIKEKKKKAKQNSNQAQKQKTKTQSRQKQDSSKGVQQQIPKIQGSYMVSSPFYQYFMHPQFFSPLYNIQYVYNIPRPY